MKKKFIKVLSFIFVFLFLVAAVPLSASAGVTDAGENIATSDVLTDLKRFGIDITQYQKDLDAKHCRMLNFLEYGYSYHTVASDYGLYVYMWNPTGKVIQTNGKNYIQMQLLDSMGNSVKGFSKYPLEYVSHSTNEGYEHLFYKFRVGNTNGFQSSLEKAMRKYDISGVELHFSGNTNSTESGVSAVYSFRGYMSYRGADTSVRNTLKQHVTDRITAGLELHGTTWKSQTSDKGAGFAYELFSVYFSVPNDIIKDYGDKNDATKGLVAVDGEFSEYKVNGLISNNSTVYNMLKDYIGVKTTAADKDIPFIMRTYKDTIAHWYCDSDIWGYSGYSQNLISRYGLAFLYNGSDFKGISEKKFAEEFYALRDELGGFYKIDVDEGRTEGKQSYTVSVEDGDLADLFSTYASNHSKWEAWWKWQGNLHSTDEYYDDIQPIEVVTPSDFPEAYTDKAIADELYISESEVSEMESFVNSAYLHGETTFIVRFAVRNYFCAGATLYENDGGWINEGWIGSDVIDNANSYYFEKTIFLDFDIMYFTWQNEYEQKAIIPVVASPIDIFGSVTPTIKPDNFGDVKDVVENVIETGKDIFEFLSKFKTVFLLIAGLLVLALIVWVLSKLGILSAIGKFFSWIGRGIGSLFGFTEKRIDKRRERKEHKEDRAWKSEEEERKRSEEKRKNDRHDWDKNDEAQKRKEDGWRNADRERAEKQRKEKESARKSEEALNRFNAKVFNDESHKKVMKRGENDKKKKK